MWLTKLLDLYSERSNKYLLLSPCPYAIGTGAEEILYGIKKAVILGKKLVIVRTRVPELLGQYKTSNEELFKIENEYIENNCFTKFFVEYLVAVIFTIWRVSSLLLRKLNIHTAHETNFPTIGSRYLWRANMDDKFSWSVYYDLNWDRFNDRKSWGVMGFKNEALATEGLIDNLFPGNSNAWYVCLHIREAGYRKDYGRREYRNNNILDYVVMIQEITSRGGYVVRMGDNTMTKLPLMDKVIDYPFSKFKSSLNDFLLIKNCKIYIGNQSGIWDVANLLSKPTISTDMVHWLHTYPVKYGDLGVYVNVYDSVKKRSLSFSEVMEAGWEAMTLCADMSSRYSVSSNTPEQLRQVVNEYFDWIENGIIYTDLQNEANQLRIEMGKKAIDEYKQERPGLDIDAYKFRYASRLESSKGAMSEFYLQDHFKQ